MMISPEYDARVLRLLEDLKPYLDDLVLVGGCASAIYRFSRYAAESPPTLLTQDIDVASRQKLPPKGRPSLLSLLKKSGFTPALGGPVSPDLMKFVQQDSDPKWEVEILCPRGSKNALEIQEGVTAQALSYTELLLYRPWRIQIPAERLDSSASGSIEVRVPNPAAYVMQKILIRNKRRRAEERQKDCHYIYEVAVVFRNALDHLGNEMGFIETEFANVPKWLKDFRSEFSTLFDSPEGTGCQEATLVAEDSSSGSAVTPEKVFHAVKKLRTALEA